MMLSPRMSALPLMMLLALATMPAAANPNDEVEILSRAYDSAEFTQTRTKAIRRLQERSYQVHSIQLQMHQGISVFVIHASKNGTRYVLKLTYPDLKIIHESRADSQRPPMPPPPRRPF